METSISAGVMIERGGKEREVLVVVRPDGKVAIPSGRVEPSDLTPMHCAMRECLEETGYAVILDGLVMIVCAKAGDHRSIGFIFHGQLAGAEGIAESKGELSIRWENLYEFWLHFAHWDVFKPEFHFYVGLALASQKHAHQVFAIVDGPNVLSTTYPP